MLLTLKNLTLQYITSLELKSVIYCILIIIEEIGEKNDKSSCSLRNHYWK